MSEKTETRYKVIFYNRGQIYEIYCESVTQGGMMGFVEIEGLLFGQTTQVVVDPSEERLRNEFKGVRRFFVPMHAVVRIDQVEKEGQSRISQRSDSESNLMPFPAVYKPGEDN
ncbi:hypothetical protein ABI59_21660 [Acidobacteria bacterium Mor1]|nr:hypothetical protein ABI59_21660 [Acidobacteria bacterium Mor1]